MELAREAFATDSAEVDQKEAKKKARTVALEAARVVQPANQQEAAAAATRPTGAQQDTRRSSRVVRKTSLGVDDYFNKTDLQPDDDKYLGEEERRAAQVHVVVWLQIGLVEIVIHAQRRLADNPAAAPGVLLGAGGTGGGRSSLLLAFRYAG
ncbi:hypothetical protein PLESTM_001399500 [Pleodorina starrii]|nr:hypothetical protein PLESTM_001399500 [Pleodorina starrii]